MILGGRFKIVRKIGEGATSVVYLVEDAQNNNKKYALKILKSEEHAEKNIRAYELAKTLNHPGIVRVFETGKIEGKTFILTEFVKGKSLDKVIGTLTEETKEQIAKEIIQALAYAHKKGIIHRDLKPQNILITEDFHAKITDFGLLRAEESTMTMTGEIAGTPAYISPEELQGKKPTYASDIFSLGVVLYELFTEKHPFKGQTLSNLIYSILHTNPEEPHRVNNEVPVRISKIISKCLVKTPTFRYQNASEVLRDWVTTRKIRIKDPIKIRKRKIAILVLFLFFFIFVGFLKLENKNKLHTIKIQGTVLKTFDRNGNLIFEKHTGSDITTYIVADIDRDGEKEVIVGTHFLKTAAEGKRIPGKDTAKIYCFSNTGKIEWVYKLNEKIIYNKPGILVIDRLLVPVNKQNLLIIGARAGKWFPYLLKSLNLNTSNTFSSSFWNSGWIFDMVALDINDDRFPDIVAGGVNNDLGMKPVVFALNGKDFQAQSPPWFGKEISEEHGVLFYTLLPGSDPVNTIGSTENGMFKIITRNGNIFYLTKEGVFLKDKNPPENCIDIINTQNLILKKIKTATDFSRQNRTKDAIYVIDTVLEKFDFKYKKHLFPLYAYLYLYRGILKSEEGLYTAAIEDFKNSAALDNEFAAPWLRLGFIYFKKFLFNKAAEYFRKSYMLNYDQWAYFYSMLSYAFSGNTKRAISMYKDYVKKDDAFFMYFSSLLFYSTGNPDSAMYYAKLAMSRYPEAIQEVRYVQYAIMIDKNNTAFKNDTVFLKKYPDLYGSYLYRKGENNKALITLKKGEKEILKDIGALSVIELWRTYYYLYLIYQQKGLQEKMYGVRKNLDAIKINPIIK